jgi:adenosylmethionine-8-amino-7-oxononanoate aminotransferase
MTTDTVYQAFYDERTVRGFLHSHSYTGNPLACRAALAVLDLLEQEPVLARNRDTAARLSAVAAPLTSHPRVRHARQLGMLWAYDVDTDDAGFSSRFHQAALQQGLLLRPIGNTLYFMPPYVIDDEAMQLLVQGSLRALDQALAS